MKKALALVIGLSMLAVAGSASLVRADCAAHKTQAAVEKPGKEAAQTATPVPADQLRTAQAEKAPTPAPEVKK